MGIQLSAFKHAQVSFRYLMDEKEICIATILCYGFVSVAK